MSRAPLTRRRSPPPASGRRDGWSFPRLAAVMAHLRGPGGCPWDRVQTIDSLKPYLIEEAYEVLSALETKDKEMVKEELGDLLLQVVFLSRLFQERGIFTIDDVIRRIVDKLVTRHPHVFGTMKADTPEEVLRIWSTVKSREKRSVLDGNPRALPALLKAQRASEKAARVGFDWPSLEAIEEKLREEIGEFRSAATKKRKEEEFGDILFTLANIARHLGFNAEIALEKANRRFMARFRYVEKSLGKRLRSAPLEEMERLWARAKRT